jgi:hypothetical protein
MLQNGWALESDFLQNDPRNRALKKGPFHRGKKKTGIKK